MFCIMQTCCPTIIFNFQFSIFHSPLSTTSQRVAASYLTVYSLLSNPLQGLYERVTGTSEGYLPPYLTPYTPLGNPLSGRIEPPLDPYPMGYRPLVEWVKALE